MSVVYYPGSRPESPIPLDGAVERQLIEYRGEFFRYFRRRLTCPEDAEDALQDFSLKVIRAANTLHDHEKIDAWFGRILRNTLTDQYRRRATRRRAEARYALEPINAVFYPESAATACTCIHDVLPALRLDHAEIIRRADLDGEPRERIAADLGVTVNNVGVRLHRARRALRTKLEERCAGCAEGDFRSCDCASTGGSRS